MKSIEIRYGIPHTGEQVTFEITGESAGYRINEKDIPGCAALYADDTTVIVPLSSLGAAILNFPPSKKR